MNAPRAAMPLGVNKTNIIPSPLNLLTLWDGRIRDQMLYRSKIKAFIILLQLFKFKLYCIFSFIHKQRKKFHVIINFYPFNKLIR